MVEALGGLGRGEGGGAGGLVRGKGVVKVAVLVLRWLWRVLCKSSGAPSLLPPLPPTSNHALRGLYGYIDISHAVASGSRRPIGPW